MTTAGNWRALADAGRWSSIDWINLDHCDQCELLERLKAVAIMSEIQNGVEVITCFARPDEVRDTELRAVAVILAEGELEAEVEGEPPVASKAWADTRAEAEAFLLETRQAPEVTEGDFELSRRKHCEEALALLDQIDFETEFYKKQIKIESEIKTESDKKTEDEIKAQYEIRIEEEREWLIEVIAGISHLAFVAGRHFQAAQLKPFEALAVRKADEVTRNQGNAPKGGEVRTARAAHERALLKDLALSEAEYQKWITKDDKGQVRQLRTLGARLSTEHAAEGLFLSSRGKLYGATWFRDFLSELRASGEINKINNTKDLRPSKPAASIRKPR